MNLHYYLKNNNKVYTLKDKVDGKPTLPAHYKFLKTRDVVKTR